MANRSLNKVILIGNLTRDPELRYTPQGSGVATFGIATNRSWTTEAGEKKDEVEFHNIVVWNRLAEICAEYLTKGKQVYVEGRLSSREWEGQDGQKRRTTEVIANEIIFLGASGGASRGDEFNVPDDLGMGEGSAAPARAAKPKAQKAEAPVEDQEVGEDIPF
jgi:single-strand DNA-binding protein